MLPIHVSTDTTKTEVIHLRCKVDWNEVIHGRGGSAETLTLACEYNMLKQEISRIRFYTNGYNMRLFDDLDVERLGILRNLIDRMMEEIEKLGK